MCANNEGSVETSQMRRLAWVFAGRICDKYQNLMGWLNLFLSDVLYIVCSWQYDGICVRFQIIKLKWTLITEISKYYDNNKLVRTELILVWTCILWTDVHAKMCVLKSTYQVHPPVHHYGDHHDPLKPEIYKAMVKFNPWWRYMCQRHKI